MINVLNICIWGREFSLPIEYEHYDNEVVSEGQIEALEQFVSHEDWVANSKMLVEEYCKESVMDDKENCKKDNVFSYIKPEAVLVKRDPECPRIALMCKYRYDIEHGLAIVFSFEGEITVGMQDIII